MKAIVLFIVLVFILGVQYVRIRRKLKRSEKIREIMVRITNLDVEFMIWVIRNPEGTSSDPKFQEITSRLIAAWEEVELILPSATARRHVQELKNRVPWGTREPLTTR